MSTQPLLVASFAVVALRNTVRGHLFPPADGTRPAGVGSLAQRANTLQLSPTPFRRTIT